MKMKMKIEKFLNSLKKFTAIVVLAQMALTPFTVNVAYASSAKIMICHYTHDNHYNSLDVSVNSSAFNGHASSDDDIIPPFYYDGNYFPGLNWPSGMSTWLDDCHNDDQDHFSVVYNGNGNDSGNPPFNGALYDDGDTVTVSGNTGNLAKAGYTFAGWNTESDGGGTHYNTGATFHIHHNTFLYAEWNRATYTVSFEENGGSTVPNETGLHYGDHVSEPTDPTRTGYTFAGWYKEAGLVSLWNFASDTIVGNTTLYAKWTAIDYTAYFEENGGSTVPNETGLHYGDHVTEPTDPTRTGYTFAGWYKEAGLVSLWNFASDTVSGDVTLYAKWEINEYSVTLYTTGDGTVSGDGVYDYGEDVDVSATPGLGWHFFNWSGEDQACDSWNQSDTINNIDRDYECTANFVQDTYVVSFVSNGGSSVSPETGLLYGSMVTEPVDPTKSGYTFLGWYSDPGLTTLWNFATDTVTGDMTLYAAWELVPVVNPPTPPTPPTPTPTSIPVTIAPPALAAAAVALPTGGPAEPTVLGTEDEDLADEDEGVLGSEDEPVRGSSDVVCPWWWIIGIILLASLSFLGGVIKAEKKDSFLRKYYYVWPPLFGAIAWVLHNYLHDDYRATWFCDNYWLLAVIVVILFEAIYWYLTGRSEEENEQK